MRLTPSLSSWPAPVSVVSMTSAVQRAGAAWADGARIKAVRRAANIAPTISARHRRRNPANTLKLAAVHGHVLDVQRDRREALVGDALGVVEVDEPERREDEPVEDAGAVRVVRDGG